MVISQQKVQVEEISVLRNKVRLVEEGIQGAHEFLYPDLELDSSPLNPRQLSTQPPSHQDYCVNQRNKPTSDPSLQPNKLSAVARGTKRKTGLQVGHRGPVSRLLSSAGRSGREGRDVSKIQGALPIPTQKPV